MSGEIKLIKCTCPHEEQDRLYGRGVRLHNPGGKPNTKEFGTKARCSVCGNLKSVK